MKSSPQSSAMGWSVMIFRGKAAQQATLATCRHLFMVLGARLVVGGWWVLMSRCGEMCVVKHHCCGEWSGGEGSVVNVAQRQRGFLPFQGQLCPCFKRSNHNAFCGALPAAIPVPAAAATRWHACSCWEVPVATSGTILCAVQAHSDGAEIPKVADVLYLEPLGKHRSQTLHSIIGRPLGTVPGAPGARKHPGPTYTFLEPMDSS
ncbi:hypothetical protein PCH_Pc22g26060 [Penicillium rubens Wisconsin 54-1255]|uniref:Uncharacterized protein n=1 Tax=Penicillium rubens (strain ATCC 28089 / DSM 1075 / NRRL 1951 / Wisconsin 54-1255) TaxID=500485 RepID=B6HTD3_PENRW|nr:hypothetical protein PCH_Pc22g26060 [Penicillium rubens Wisconsin 54-1255]